MRRHLAPLAGALAALLAAVSAQAQTPVKPQTHEGDLIVRDFHFRSGETLPELRLHYTTIGTPRRDASGRVVNAVMVLHGTGGSGAQFLRPQFADVLFQPGGVLDPAKYFIILPDDVGHGKSSKPSDGLHARFPHYDYDDMVELERRVLVDGLHVDHLRLIMGTSMGCMHAFMWGETYPDGAKALMPLACLPVEIAGRNRLWRAMAAGAITSDPAYAGGDYKEEPAQGLRAAEDILMIAGASPLPMQIAYPTGAAVRAWYAEELPRRLKGLDANDLVYALEASRTYDPSKDLEKITAPVTWINSADDFINPPELGIADKMAPRLKNGRFVLIPASPNTHGHGTHTWAALWQDQLAALLKRSE